MNYIVVRTKLQAIFALELLKLGEIERPFHLVELYRYHFSEDSDAVYRYYNLLADQAERRVRLVQEKGFWKPVFFFSFALVRAAVTRGNVNLAVINFYPLAVALKMCPFCSIRTFDDGTANIQKRSTSYHSTAALPKNSVRRRIANKIFPRGASSFVRSRIRRHFSIYDEENIVPREKVSRVGIAWCDYFHPDDAQKLMGNIKSVVFGTVFSELTPNFHALMVKKRDDALALCDIYIPHPREIIEKENKKVLRMISPAESVIDFLIGKGDLTIYHFNSSAVIPFLCAPGIRLVDLSRAEESVREVNTLSS